MRVLQFGRFWNEEHGGVERHAALLCKGLAAQGMDVVNLVAALPGKPSSDEMHADSYRLVQVPSYGMVVSTAVAPSLPLKALALHREKPFDIFHLHLPDPLSHLTSLLLPRGVPRVLTWHSDVIRQKRLLNLYMPLLRRELRHAAAIVSGTEAHFSSSTQIPPDLPADRKHVIPYGLDYSPLVATTQVRVQADALRRRASGRPVLFALGRHVYYKGFEVLIKAMKRIDALLYLGGSGPLLKDHRSLANALGVTDRVVFCGRIPEDELAAYFHACDLFCLPSVAQSEAFGLVQLEAMACGKPVIASQLHNGVNVVNLDGITGVAVPPSDVEALARAISQLLADAPRKVRMGQQAQQRALSIYSLSNMAHQTTRLYYSLLD
ncbi:MAG: glycosyltransferase [Xylophilus ampelinus]